MCFYCCAIFEKYCNILLKTSFVIFVSKYDFIFCKGISYTFTFSSNLTTLTSDMYLFGGLIVLPLIVCTGCFNEHGTYNFFSYLHFGRIEGVGIGILVGCILNDEDAESSQR